MYADVFRKASTGSPLSVVGVDAAKLGLSTSVDWE